MQQRKPKVLLISSPINRAPLAHFGIPRILMDQSDRLHICCSSQPVYMVSCTQLMRIYNINIVLYFAVKWKYMLYYSSQIGLTRLISYARGLCCVLSELTHNGRPSPMTKRFFVLYYLFILDNPP